MEIYVGQNLFSILSRLCDFTALDGEMQEIADAVKKDNPQLQNLTIPIVENSFELGYEKGCKDTAQVAVDSFTKGLK